MNNYKEIVIVSNNNYKLKLILIININKFSKIIKIKMIQIA